MRAGVQVVLLVLLLAVAAACGSSASPPDVATQDPGAVPAETEDPGGGAAAASEPVPPASEPAAAPAAGGGTLPAIADGPYLTGQIHADFGGSHPMTVDAPLVGGASITSVGFTSLMYKLGEDPNSTIVQVVLDPEQGGPAVSLTSPTVMAAGGVAEGCTATVDKNDASGISGTVTCPAALPGLVVGSNDAVQDSVTATWSAER